MRGRGFDLLIVARGGGSIGNLWPFNDEALAKKKQAQLVSVLDAVSPLRAIDRGYAVVSNTAGDVVKSTAQLEQGMTVRTRLASGVFAAEMVALEPPE